ncbi:hypothetical protein [uncultured Mesotoga sp.]|mgnify:CR=1 FL=1|uniref:hypothetical protein n=1 Tax=uncultured Mesotoga sp. TaxID=1184400 RepID=UPI0025961FCE|nr:hypothetical protein [uncultured Mesotoga sp.]
MWKCKSCGRINDDSEDRCRCGYVRPIHNNAKSSGGQNVKKNKKALLIGISALSVVLVIILSVMFFGNKEEITKGTTWRDVALLVQESQEKLQELGEKTD